MWTLINRIEGKMEGRSVPLTRGSFTVEASILMPVIFLCIIAVVYISLLLYQMALVQAISDRSAERGTATWSNPRKDISTGLIAKEELKSGGIYWRLLDINRDEKVKRLDTYFVKQMGHFDVLKGSYSVSPPEVKDYIIYKKLVLNTESRYKLPFGKLLSCFGLEEHVSFKTRSEAMINEPVEFIRNTDLIIDLEQEVELCNEGAAKLGNTIRGYMQKIIEKVADFFDTK